MSALWCATSRFSSVVMPWKSRMFWKVRATRAWRAISWSGIRSSRKSSPLGVVACRPLERVTAAMSSCGRNAITGKGEAPLGRLVEASHAIEDRRLACAVRADERGDVSPSDRKAEGVTATRPPNRIVRFSTASSGPGSQFINRVPL